VVRALDRMGQDVREASVIELPPLIPADRVPPPFVHTSPQVSTGRLQLMNEKPLINASARGLTSARERVTWFLDKPKKIGLTPGGTQALTYSLFRSVETTPVSRPQEVVGSVTELTVWRTLRDANIGPAGMGTGPSVLYVSLKIANRVSARTAG